MNIAYFLTPKQEIASLFDDNTFRKGLETMRSRGFTAMPVTTRDNIYVGAVSTSDFLWYLVNDEYDEEGHVLTRPTNGVLVRDVMRKGTHPPVPITATVEELMDRILQQNFVPVVDARGAFIGIITRRKVMGYFKSTVPPAQNEP
ncbi:MAG: CBS domain-containing protein [Oscillospiraceae bacterium]|nr:CBS domain-containing protein [Oscillospiraceae bacterium]